MKKNLLYLLFVIAMSQISCITSNNLAMHSLPTPIATWDFIADGEKAFVSSGTEQYTLFPGTGVYPEVQRDSKGVRYIHFNGENDFLYIPTENTKNLDIKTGEVTVIALIRWEGKPNCFVAGMWNEYASGGKRQYGLFVSLPHYNGDKKVCGHISKNGGPTPPFPYSIDYSTSKSDVSVGYWHIIAMTYDGTYIKSYYDGDCEKVDEALINHTTGFEGYPNGLIQAKNPYYYPDGMGNNGSDFTVGAVELASGMGNFFKGDIARIMVYNQCLDETEIKETCLTIIRKTITKNVHEKTL